MRDLPAPPTMEWSREGSPWSPVPVADPMWSLFTHDQRVALHDGAEVLLDSGTSWRVPAEHRQPGHQLALFA